MWVTCGLLCFPLAMLIVRLRDIDAKVMTGFSIDEIKKVLFTVICLGPFLFYLGLIELIKVYPNRDTKEKYLLRKMES